MGSQHMAQHHTSRFPSLPSRQDGVVPVLKVRVAASWEVKDADFADMHVIMSIQGEGVHLTDPNVPLLVARRFSGSAGDVEMPEFTVFSAIKRMLGLGGAHVLDLYGLERQQIPGDSRVWYRYWAVLGSKVSLAMELQSNGSVMVVDLA